MNSNAAPPPVDSTARTFDTEGSGSGDRVNSMVFTDVTRIAGITYLHTVPDPLLGKTEPADMIAGAVAEDFDSDGWVDLTSGAADEGEMGMLDRVGSG